mgnify:CR=1 FL=1
MRRRILKALAHLALHRYKLVLAAAVLLTAGAAALTAFRGKLATDLRTLLPPGARYCEALRLAMRSFGSTEELLIVIEADAPAAIEAAKPRLAHLPERLLQHSELVTDVYYKVGEQQERFIRDHIAEKAFLYLAEEDYPLVEQKFSKEGMRRELERAMALFKADPALFRERALPDPLNFLELFERYGKRMGGTYRSAGPDRYLISPDGTMMLAVVRAKGVPQDLDFAHKLMNTVRREARETLESGELGYTVNYAGGYAVAVQEDKTLRKDVFSTFGLSLAAVLLLFGLLALQKVLAFAQRRK